MIGQFNNLNFNSESGWKLVVDVAAEESNHDIWAQCLQSTALLLTASLLA